jgi:hypothetical protein
MTPSIRYRASEHIVPRQALERILLVSPTYHVSRVTLVMNPCNLMCRFMCVRVAYCGNLEGKKIGIYK